ncbi:mechanosensitive ion channel domain-containing protein [Virgibacillus salexigens]|uniref:mechanosensitive ion channel domain-containing protein n=1 Tax=Virgibacillus salexigens TaxID=61016 RepID=UPI0027E550CA|nr:mechanosensitive ion channel domain-containing protein [Virgibacillus salexigens]
MANLFGGIIIITEKPFTIGDWILTPSVEGTVEDISFRSTKIRTFAQALVTVPKATLANESITNWSKMGKRQITFSLRLTYDTSREKVESVVSQIELSLRENKNIHQDTIFVLIPIKKMDSMFFCISLRKQPIGEII